MMDVRAALESQIKSGIVTIAEAVRKTGLSRATIDRFIRKQHDPNPPTLRLIREFVESNATTAPAGISPTPVLPVPTWEVNILASAWIHVPLCAMDTNDPKQAALIKLGRFRLKIIGDCMEPKYRSGDTVEFRRLVYGEDTLIPGKAYVFCRNDDTATFKILHSMPDEGTLILCALNRKEYPDPLPPVLRDEIVSVAIAEGKFVTDDAIDPGQIDAEAMAQLAAAAKQYGLSLSDVIRKAIPRGPMKSKTPKRKAHAR